MKSENPYVGLEVVVCFNDGVVKEGILYNDNEILLTSSEKIDIKNCIYKLRSDVVFTDKGVIW